MKYGYFDDTNREYVITVPATPLPWINYLGTKDFFSIISNTAGGYSFFRDARLRRITRYRYNGVPTDSGGRYFYINENGDLWSPGWKPVRAELEEYRCRHGLGYTVVEGKRNGLSAELLFFVPIDGWCEVQRLRLRNDTRAAKSFKLFSFAEFCLWNGLDDMTNLQRNLSTGEVEVEGSTIYHKTEYRERRDHFAFYAVNAPVDGFDTDRESFLGPYGGFDRPEAAVRGRALNSRASGWSPIASHQIDCTLKPGESRDFVFLLGYVENPSDRKWAAPGVINKEGAHRLMERFAGSEEVEGELASLRSHWSDLLAGFQIKSADERLDRMVNIWNQYQCVVTFNLSRSASFFETGIGRGIGFRDTNQDLLGCMHQIPEAARRRILDVAATQFAGGGAYHQYQPLTKRGNDEIGGNFNDDPLWLILSVCSFIKETGNWAILDERVPFAGPSGGNAAGSRETPPTLLDHLRASFAHTTANLGPHGLPLIGRADWNDCLNLNTYSTNPDESFQTTTTRDGKVAESVFIAGLFVVVGRELAGLFTHCGLAEEARAALAAVATMEHVVTEHGWDGKWYLRAYDHAGKRVGSRECEEGRIYIEPQGLCAIAQIGAQRGYPLQALDSVKEHLDTPHGIMILQPAYSAYHVELGEVSSYPPGYKENAGVFCHNNPWVMIGETILGRGNRAFEYYRKIAPAYLEEVSELHRTEPYVYSQMIAGRDAKRQGEAKNSWLTGTAAWNFVAISQWILGIRPDYDGLRIDPCLPEHLRSYSVTRRFRNAIYQITFSNPLGLERGSIVLTVDGRPVAGNMVPAFGDGKEHEVAVTIGPRE